MEGLTLLNLIQVTSGLAGRKDAPLWVNGEQLKEIRISMEGGSPKVNLLSNASGVGSETGGGNDAPGHPEAGESPGSADGPDSPDCTDSEDSTDSRGGSTAEGTHGNMEGGPKNPDGGQYIVVSLDKSGVYGMPGKYTDFDTALDDCYGMAKAAVSIQGSQIDAAITGVNLPGQGAIARFEVRKDGVSNVWQIFKL